MTEWHRYLADLGLYESGKIWIYTTIATVAEAHTFVRLVRGLNSTDPLALVVLVTPPRARMGEPERRAPYELTIPWHAIRSYRCTPPETTT